MKTYSNPHIGCYFDHASRNNTELSVDILKLAIEYGYAPDDTDKALLLCFEQGWLNDDASEALDEASEDAIEWLNGQETRSHLYWANEGEAGAFGLWPNVEGAKEDCEFTSTKQQDYPDDDYRGEWLHVNDHAASEWLRRHTYKLPSYAEPRVWIEFSKERGGYVFRPNMAFVPSKNENWKCVMENDAA